jgi:hypothetical protein
MGQKNSLPMEGVDGFSVEEVNSFFIFLFLISIISIFAFLLIYLFCIIFLIFMIFRDIWLPSCEQLKQSTHSFSGKSNKKLFWITL